MLPPMTGQLDVSIVLCTRDRVHLLRDALESLLAIEHPPERFELVLVDNGSRDATAEVVRNFTRRAPFAVRYCYEATPGLSAARNRGIAEAHGEYLFFTDDDQLVEPRALAEHLRVARRYGSRVQQGGISLRFTEGRPDWLSPRLATVLGQTREAPEGPADIDLFGGNMFFLRSVFDGFEPFRVDLGKGTAGYSEDIEITRRLRTAGERIVYAPSAQVVHVIGPDRSSVGFFRKNSWEKGYSDAIMVASGRPLPLSLGVDGVLAIANAWLVILHALRRAPADRVVCETRVANRLGRMAGAVRARTARTRRS